MREWKSGMFGKLLSVRGVWFVTYPSRERAG